MLLIEEFVYNKSKLAQLSLAVGLMLTVAGLLLLLQNVFAQEISIEEREARIDALCDDEDSDTTLIEACKSEERKEKDIEEGGKLLEESAKKMASYYEKQDREKEKAAKEDAICDDEDAKTTKIDMCKAKDEDEKPVPVNKLTPQVKVSAATNKDLREDEEVKEVCDEVGGKMTKDGCHTDHDGPMADKFEELMTERNQEVKPKLHVPSLLEGTLTEAQKEALSKENPDWEFKSDVNIPNSLEGKLTQEQVKL